MLFSNCKIASYSSEILLIILLYSLPQARYLKAEVKHSNFMENTGKSTSLYRSS